MALRFVLLMRTFLLARKDLDDSVLGFPPKLSLPLYLAVPAGAVVFSLRNCRCPACNGCLGSDEARASSRDAASRSNDHGEEMKGAKQGAMVFLILGVAMLAVGAAGQRTFLVIGAVFIALAAATFARFLRS